MPGLIRHTRNLIFERIEFRINGIGTYAGDLKNSLDGIFKRWTSFADSMVQIPQELMAVNEPAVTINGFMSIIKTKTAEIQGILNRIADTSKQLNKQLSKLNIRSQIESIAASINEEPKRYRTL